MSTQFSLPSHKKILIEEHFSKYNLLVGNKLTFTNPQSYETISGLNFAGNTIFDLEKSMLSLKRVLNFIKNIKKNKGTILFVGTREDIKEIVKYIGTETKSPYVNERWLKGLLTNWENGSNSIRFYNIFLKKLVLRSKQKTKLIKTFFGLVNLTKLPDAIFIFDLNTDMDVLKEAKLLNIPIIAISDTNASFNDIDYPILGNSGSLISLAFFSNLILSAFQVKSDKGRV